jgi:hypothetical protein
MLLSRLEDAFLAKFEIELKPGTDISDLEELLTTEEILPAPPGKLLTPLAIVAAETCNAPELTERAAWYNPVDPELPLFIKELVLAYPPTVGLKLFTLEFTDACMNPPIPVLDNAPVTERDEPDELAPTIPCIASDPLIAEVAAPTAPSEELVARPPILPVIPPIAPTVDPPVLPDSVPDIEPVKLFSPLDSDNDPPMLAALAVLDADCFAKTVRFWGTPACKGLKLAAIA